MLLIRLYLTDVSEFDTRPCYCRVSHTNQNLCVAVTKKKLSSAGISHSWCQEINSALPSRYWQREGRTTKWSPGANARCFPKTRRGWDSDVNALVFNRLPTKSEFDTRLFYSGGVYFPTSHRAGFDTRLFYRGEPRKTRDSCMAVWKMFGLVGISSYLGASGVKWYT